MFVVESSKHFLLQSDSTSLHFPSPSTASAFSPLVATALAQRVSPVAPGALYPFFAVFALIGMFISRKIHHDGGVEEGAESPTNEMAQGTEKENDYDGEEETEREII